jgi:hypothetical protein
MISLLSGVGLLAVVSIAPVKQYDAPGPLVPIKSEITPSEKSYLPSNSNSDLAVIKSNSIAQDEFSLNASNISSMPATSKELADIFSRSGSELKFNTASAQTDWDLYENMIGEKKVFFQKDGLVLRSINDQRTFAQNPQFFRRDFNPLDRYSTRRFDTIEVQYAITPNIGAVFQGGNYDHTDDRSRIQRNVAMAGISINSGDLFQAKVLTGDSSYVQTPLASYNYNPLNPSRPNDISRRERDDVRQLYEWQANFTPSEYFKFQTSLYNQRAENSLNMSSPDGGKVSVFFGGKKVQLNLRYNYLANKSNPGSQQFFSPSQDLASLGVIVFLDQSQRYSLYVGNNYHNVLNDPANQVRDASGRSPSTFTASFRGKNPSSSRSSFFFNVQNQFYKDGAILGVPGMIPIGSQQGKSFYEYATSLGVDVSF